MGAVGRRNLARLAEEVFERRGDYPAIWFEGRWVGSAQMFERAARLASGLAARGIGPGDRVVVMLANSPDVPVVYQAIARAGAVVTPVIFPLPVDEVRAIVADAEPALVITSPEFRTTVEQAAGGVPVVVSGAELDGLAAHDPGAIVARADDDMAALMYTGGTTGRAKGVMLTHANLWEAGRRGHEAGHVPGVARSLTCLPLSHSYGLLVVGVGMHHPDRPRSALMRWFDARTWLELAQEHRAQTAAVVPSMLRLLLAEPLEAYDLSALQGITCGAAPLPAETRRELERRLPGVELREGYGLTETSALVSTNPPGRVRPGTVGRPVGATGLRILDELGRDVPRGEVGEICVRSLLVMAGYWRAPELTAATARDGWLHTGDMGRLDDDGYLTIVDRRKDLIIRDGFNVFPRDVEEALLEHPAVSGACVLGRPDEEHGEEVVAFVTLAGGADAEVSESNLVAFGRRRLGGYKYPREVHVLASLPLTPVGKVDRRALRAALPPAPDAGPSPATGGAGA